ncbi:histidine kinase [Methylobacterium sp. 77]|uniref:sensor histidine kinase n=1 Tax=Methylobacterium sp. 77 TaxID=1101192 RepID=UPI0003650108|nr:histidine kinase [Methylobacterium sp. 77]
MRLLAGLIARILIVTLLCLGAASLWVMRETGRAIRAETEASAERVVRDLRFSAWHELMWRGQDARFTGMPAWSAIPPDLAKASATLRGWLHMIGPGVCVVVRLTEPGAVAGEGAAPICGAWAGLGSPAPPWFGALQEHLFGRDETVTRAVLVNGREAGLVSAKPDGDAGLRQTWQRVRVSVGVAAAMAAGIAILASILIGWALWPAGMIVDRLRQLARGSEARRLPRFRSAEFDRIAGAVNDLGRQLAENRSNHASLMRRLFAVQEEERRAIALDLHDEFGQCLTATEALATAIEVSSDDRPDIAADARMIVATTMRMMAGLRSALAHLRPPDLAEIGFSASLHRLAAQTGTRAGPACRIDLQGDLDDLPGPLGITLYRIAQEGLTNAIRHGRSRTVWMRAEARPGAMVSLTVEDDGGGHPSGLTSEAGQGVLGMRERVAAHGGSLVIERAALGIRLIATLPLPLPLPLPLASGSASIQGASA